MRALLRVTTLIAVLLLAACGDANAPDAPTATPTSRPDPTAIPTPEGWTSAALPITLDTASQFRELGRLDAPEPPSTVFSHAISLDNALMAGLNNEFLIVWDLVTGKSIFGSARRGANAVYFGPDRAEVYTLGNNRNLQIFDARTGDSLGSFQVFNSYNGISAYDAFGGWLAVGSDIGRIQIWDMPARNTPPLLNAAEVPIAALAFSPDGATLASADRNGTVRVWDFQNTTETVQTDLLTPVTAIAYAPSGDTLAVNSGDGVLLLDSATLEVRARLTATNEAGIFAFMGQTDTLIVGGQSGDVTLWDTTDGTLAATLPSTAGSRPSAAASPDHTMLFTSTRESASLWNISQLDSGAVLRGNAALPQTDTLRVVWTADGLQVLLFEALGPIRVFGIP